MRCAEDDSPPYIASYRTGPYSASIASSASSSNASVWSDAASQSSDDSSVAGASDNENTSDYDCTSIFTSTSTSTSASASASAFTSASSSTPNASNVCAEAVSTYWPKHKFSVQLAPEQRQHPRRTSVPANVRTGCPPALVRQCDRKVTFVDGLVDSSAQIVEAIWPLSSVVCRSEMGNKGVLPLRTFIQETLRRSRTSYSTLQVALYYLILIKPHVPRHDFTMEQPDDAHSSRALQCGRRMFLAALILASKYLQDRNYSARAWSKISGLNTLEINQNEMAFLLAVNWQLHITDAVFNRWTDIVVKYTHTQAPSPGSACTAGQTAGWKSIISKLNPGLDNVDSSSPAAPVKADAKPVATYQPSSVSSITERKDIFGYSSSESTPTQKYYTPSVMEPSPSSTISTSKPAPALGLLPTPRLTPQSIGFNTPAVSAASLMLSKPSMGYAMAQASSICAAQLTEKWQPYVTSSPQSYVSHRRSSLANSVSSVSSPESMVSDSSSRSSRSSSISSASSLACAPLSSKLDVQARCRYAKLCSEKQNRTYIATVPETYCDGPTSSPESCTGPVGKEFLEMSLETPPARREVDLDYFSKDEEAARALQELHNHPRSMDSPTRAGAKRARPQSIDNSLQENVRDMLSGSYQSSENSWSDDLVRSRRAVMMRESSQVAYDRSTSPAALGRKRVCCATEASRALSKSDLHPTLGGFGGPGMWQGILN